jgi:antitoxin ParD1/3/4
MGKVEKISVSLPKDMVQALNKAVDSGGYATVSEVVREALRRWEIERAEQDRLHNQAIETYGLEGLRKIVQEGIDSLEKEGGIPIEDVRAELTARYRAMAKAKNKKRSA